ncbi:hypothetical protein SASPL_146227 [Salvia splendens]|uniref:Uncharacterized protein n=1 Tax=Salvia splendens TaxID=180675 RepID=A0A8X8Z5K5_SALSN|nr:hypothetical protein SASPL_146227 [Salvia splendens]
MAEAPAASTSGSLRCGGACGCRLPPPLPLRALRLLHFGQFSHFEEYALSIIFVAIFLFLLSRNKGLVSRNVNFFKQTRDEYGKRLGFLRFALRTHSKPVQWFIGEAELESRKIVRKRYEGDWIDEKYNEYGIESWARGSRYRGQYRHGYGVYKFYTWDSYAGEWCNGQSHGVGAQTYGDGSCFVSEFKSGVKHGFGCYHLSLGLTSVVD